MRDAALNAIGRLIETDERAVFIGSDLGPATMAKWRRDFPSRCFMEGVSEQHCVNLATGMALEGMTPFVNTISTFLTRRAFEQVVIASMHGVPIRLLGNGGGLVYAPLGPTHIAHDDIALMRAVPNMTIVCPADPGEMARAIAASRGWPHPIYFRIGVGGNILPAKDSFEIGRAYPINPRVGKPAPVVIATTGNMVIPCMGAVDILFENGIRADVVHFPTVKPIDRSGVSLHVVHERDAIVTVEEGLAEGGLGTAILEELGPGHPNVVRIGVPECFPCSYGTRDDMLHRYGLTAEQIASRIMDEC